MKRESRHLVLLLPTLQLATSWRFTEHLVKVLEEEIHQQQQQQQ